MKRLNYSYNMNYMLDPPDDDPPEEDTDNEYEIEAYLCDKESEERYYDTLPGHGFSGSRR
jgi:hypothetical protein